MLIGAGAQDPDENDFTALRILIDVARDTRDAGARSFLKPSTARSQHRVWRFAPPRLQRNPSAGMLADLVMLASSYDRSVTGDETDDPVAPHVDDLVSRIAQGDESRLVEAALAKDALSAVRDDQLEEVVARYFTSQAPSLPDGFGRMTQVAELRNAIAEAEGHLQPFLDRRSKDLETARTRFDSNMRSDEELRSELERAATDRSFGQSGRILKAIGRAHGSLLSEQKKRIDNATKGRNSLSGEYIVQLETARAEHRKSPALSDFKELGDFHHQSSALLNEVANWAPAKRYRRFWLLFVLSYAALVGSALLLRPSAAQLTLATGILIALVLVPAMLAGWLLILCWRRFEKRRSQAATRAIEAYRSLVARIDMITRLALAHLAASRIAGRIEPFSRLLRHRMDDLDDLRSATKRVFDFIRPEGRHAAAMLGAERAVDHRKIEGKLAEVDTQDSLKIVLSEATPPETASLELVSGEFSGGLVLPTVLVLDAPVRIEFVPAPPPVSAPAAQPVPTEPGEQQAKKTAARGTVRGKRSRR